MWTFVKLWEKGATDNLHKIAKLNASETATDMAASESDLGFVARTTVIQTFKEKKPSQFQVFAFGKECETTLGIIVTKMKSRSPEKYNFARKMESFDSTIMVAKVESTIEMFSRCSHNIRNKMDHLGKLIQFWIWSQTISSQ